MSTEKPRSATADHAPWWLEPGAEQCEFCRLSVHYQALYYCSECDRPMCMTCTVTVVERHTVLCSECHGGGMH